MSIAFGRCLARRVTSTPSRNGFQSTSTREYARLSLIGNLVHDAKLIDRGEEKPSMVALKIATSDSQSREAKEAGRTPSTSFHDVVCFNPGLNQHLVKYKRGTLVHVQADMRMQPQEQIDPSYYRAAVVRLTLREINQLQEPKTETGTS